MKFPIIFLINLMCCFPLFGQCPDGLFAGEGSYSIEQVKYGKNVNILGDTIELMMDIYLPNNEFEERPVAIFAFGGGFTSGSRQSPIMTGLCDIFASQGWVAASIDYRLFPEAELGTPDSLELMDAVIKAIGDMRGAVRHFRASHDNGNPYKINPDFIVVGGFSAGAFMALHTNLLDEEDFESLPSGLRILFEQNGGIEGNTGDANNRSYPSHVSAAIAFSGAVLDTQFIDASDPPIFMLHGTNDQTVPINRGQSIETATTFGSAAIATRSENIGHEYLFVPMNGAGHVNYWFPALFTEEKDLFFGSTQEILSTQYCDLLSSLEPLRSASIQFFPNPVQNSAYVDFPHNHPTDLKIFDLNGKLMLHNTHYYSGTPIALGSFQSGIYFVVVDNQYAQKFSKF